MKQYRCKTLEKDSSDQELDLDKIITLAGDSSNSESTTIAR